MPAELLGRRPDSFTDIEEFMQALPERYRNPNNGADNSFIANLRTLVGDCIAAGKGRYPVNWT